jgi:hypothetical protein
MKVRARFCVAQIETANVRVVATVRSGQSAGTARDFAQARMAWTSSARVTLTSREHPENWRAGRGKLLAPSRTGWQVPRAECAGRIARRRARVQRPVAAREPWSIDRRVRRRSIRGIRARRLARDSSGNPRSCARGAACAWRPHRGAGAESGARASRWIRELLQCNGRRGMGATGRFQESCLDSARGSH